MAIVAIFHRETITPTKAEVIARWAPTTPWGPPAEALRIYGGGWSQERVPVDGFELVSDGATSAVLHNERLELTFHRRPAPGPQPEIGLMGTWNSDGGPVVLTEVRDRATTGR